jgi:hypothetical protein
MRSGRIFWGLVILLIGVFLLLEPLGIIPEDVNLWQFVLPVIIILAGIWLLIVPVINRGRKLEVESVSIPLEDTREARIRLKHGAGRLEIGPTGDAQTLVAGDFGGGVEQSLQRDGDAVRLKLRTPSQAFPFPMGVGFEGLNWQVRLNPVIPMRLDIDSGASETILDLTSLNVYELNIETGASSTRIKMPENAGQTKVRIGSGAASVEMRIPASVAARIRVESGLAGIHVDQNRFPRLGNYYESPDFENASNRLDVFVKTGVGSLDIR